jgi:GT2 family glycosyltransferase
MISIIIVSWNAKDYLLQCLASLNTLNPTGPQGQPEIIVVDNASADGSAEAVAAYYPKVRLIRNPENVGFSRANNIGIKASRGDYLAFVNSDVEVLPGCIDALVDFFETDPRVGMVGPKLVGKDRRLQRSARGFPTLWNQFCRALALDKLVPSKIFSGYAMTYWGHRTCETVDILQGSFMLVKRAALEEVGFWDEEFFIYGEDVDLCRRFRKGGWKVVFVPWARAIHYGGASSANAPVRFYIEKQRADLQYWRKHEPSLAVGGYFLIAALHETLRALGYALPALISGAARYKVKRSVACLRWLLLNDASLLKS